MAACDAKLMFINLVTNWQGSFPKTFNYLATFWKQGNIKRVFNATAPNKFLEMAKKF